MSCSAKNIRNDVDGFAVIRWSVDADAKHVLVEDALLELVGLEQQDSLAKVKGQFSHPRLLDDNISLALKGRGFVESLVTRVRHSKTGKQVSLVMEFSADPAQLDTHCALS